MQAYEIVIIVAACAFVLGVAVWRIVKIKKGKGGCDCGGCCSACGGCGKCNSSSRHPERRER